MRSVVSVVVPTKNRWELLRRAVASVDTQEGVEVELVVVDDGSDASIHDVPWLAGRTTPTTLLRHEASLGVARARNAATAATTGELVAYLDDDDLWGPTHLAELVALLHAPRVLAFSRHLVIDAEGRPLSPGRQVDGEQTLRRLLDGNSVVTPSSVLAVRQAVLDVGGFDASFSILADWDLWLRLAQLGPVVPSPGVTAAYTQHDSNMHRDSVKLLEETARLREKLEPLLRAERAGLGGEIFWQWVAATAAPDRQKRLGLRWFLRSSWPHRRPADVLRGIRALAEAPRLDHGRVEGLEAPEAPIWLPRASAGGGR